MLSDLLTGFNTTLDPWKMVLNLFLSVMLGLLVSLVYVSGVRKPDRKMARLFPVLAAAMTLASSLIASSLGIAIGLVGALSIIRFRTVVHELNQMVFLFLAVGAGLAASTGHFLTGALAILIFAVYIFTYAYFRNKRGEVVRISIKGNGSVVGPLLDQLQAKHPKLGCEGMDQQSGHTTWHLSCRIHKHEEFFALRERLSASSDISFSLTSTDEAG